MLALPDKAKGGQMIITLSGSNTFLLRQKLDQLVSDFVKKNGDLALERIDASEAEPAQILEAVQSLPFLSAEKMVVINQLSSNKPAVEQIEQIINSDSSETTVILYEPLTDKRTSYYKTLKSKTQFGEFNEVDSRDLPKWLASEAKNIGAELTHSDASYMVDRLGPNQAILYSELHKISISSPKITRQLIDEQTDKSPQSKIFDLLDAMFGGRTAKALELYEEQRAQKVEPQAILALIAWQLNLIALAKAAQGKTGAQIAAEAKVSPFPVQKAQALAAKITDDKLRKIIQEATEIDYSSKTYISDLDEALKAFIVSL